MTSRLCFEGLLTELSKVNAPSMLLQDFNYFFNKAINQYVNKRYNIYDVNLLTTDDLRVLKATTLIQDPKPLELPGIEDINTFNTGNSKMFGGSYYINLPLDYLHMLNCICIYQLDKSYKCYDKDNYVLFAAKRLTGDSWSVIMNDFYNRPLPERPYYYINNVNTSNELPTNPMQSSILERNFNGTDTFDDLDIAINIKINGIKYKDIDTLYSELIKYEWHTKEEDLKDIKNQGCVKYYDLDRISTFISNEMGDSAPDITFEKNKQLPRFIKIGQRNSSLVEREGGLRYGNQQGVRCEIRYGLDNSVFRLVGVLIDYIKAPKHIRLTQEQVNLTEDTSLMMEFPDYVCQEIINELVLLVMENTADPRLQTHSAVTLSIASPVQQLTQPTATQKSST